MIIKSIEEIVYNILLANKQDDGKSIISTERILELKPGLTAEQVSKAALALQRQGKVTTFYADNTLLTISLVNR